MSKFNGSEETKYSVLMLGEKFLMIGLSNAMKVVFFLYCINLLIFLPLNPAIYIELPMYQIFCVLDVRNKMSLTPHLTFYCKIFKIQ